MKKPAKKYEKTLCVSLPDTLEKLLELEKRNLAQGNPLIEAVFVQPFKELELKVLCLISKYANEINNFDPSLEGYREKLIKISISKKEFCELLKTNPLNFYQQIKILANELTSKKIKLACSNKVFETIVLFPRVSCREGMVTFYLSPILMPYLNALNKNFTILSLEYITNMGSTYAIKIYQLLKQYQNFGKRTFEVEELKKILGIEHLYSTFNDFGKEVLSTTLKHINNFTDLQVGLIKQKQGRVVGSITFTIDIKETQLQQAEKIFKSEIDALMKKDIPFLATEHNVMRKKWAAKNTDLFSKLFHLWIDARVISYQAASIEKLQLTSSKKRVPEWYIDLVEKHLFERLKITQENK